MTSLWPSESLKYLLLLYFSNIPLWEVNSLWIYVLCGFDGKFLCGRHKKYRWEHKCLKLWPPYELRNTLKIPFTALSSNIPLWEVNSLCIYVLCGFDGKFLWGRHKKYRWEHKCIRLWPPYDLWKHP